QEIGISGLRFSASDLDWPAILIFPPARSSSGIRRAAASKTRTASDRANDLQKTRLRRRPSSARRAISIRGGDGFLAGTDDWFYPWPAGSPAACPSRPTRS